MSDGHFCLVRDLGLVKGGKGLKHHEVVLDISLRGIVGLGRRLMVDGIKRAVRALPRGQDEVASEDGRPGLVMLRRSRRS